MRTQLAQQDNVDVLAGGLFSPECLGVQSLAAKLQMVYVPLNGCASDVLTTKSCDKYTFRVFPVGRSDERPDGRATEVKTFGTKWGIIYPDYALGQSTLATVEAALTEERRGVRRSAKIAVPLGEANVTPYVTKIPTDGSIQVLQVIRDRQRPGARDERDPAVRHQPEGGDRHRARQGVVRGRLSRTR